VYVVVYNKLETALLFVRFSLHQLYDRRDLGQPCHMTGQAACGAVGLLDAVQKWLSEAQTGMSAMPTDSSAGVIPPYALC